MKIKKKGKVHPSPSSSSSTAAAAAATISSSSDVLNNLPPEILSLLTPLTVGDREVLAFMMKRSMQTSSPSTSSAKKFSRRASKKSRAPRANSGNACFHAPPSCTCFYCYTSYWNRWDSSPNRDLIHQAIEAYDEKLANGEKAGRRSSEKPASVPPIPPLPEVRPFPIDEGSDLNATEGNGELSRTEDETATATAAAAVVQSPAPNNHRGLARRVWPDVLGLFNSRLWRLWGPN